MPGATNQKEEDMSAVTDPLPAIADKLLHTLERCEGGARHEIDLARLLLIKRLIIWATQRDDHAAYWDAELKEAEHAVDVKGGGG